MRVLGVDPGLTRCGVGVVEGEPGRTCRLVAVDVITSDPRDDLGSRLLALDTALARILATYTPDAVAVERVFSQHNVRTVMGTAQAGAIAVLAGARAGLVVQTYTPSEVKAAVTGSGQADKAQVTAMVTRLLKLATAPRPADAADALALAICHVWRGGVQAKIAQARAMVEQASARAAAVRSATRDQITVRSPARGRAGNPPLPGRAGNPPPPGRAGNPPPPGRAGNPSPSVPSGHLSPPVRAGDPAPAVGLGDPSRPTGSAADPAQDELAAARERRTVVQRATAVAAVVAGNGDQMTERSQSGEDVR